MSVGMGTSLGFLTMSLTSINDFSNDIKAAISPAADAPIVPANATMVAFSPITSRLRTITSHFANERGEQNDNVPELGLKMYGLSFWLYIDPMNPSSSPQATDYTTVLSYGDTPKITYNSMLNKLRIGIKTESNKIKKVDDIKSLPLQKWNHIVLNYLNGTCDVFVNSELHATKIEVIPIKEDKIFEIGAEDGIRGKICNVIFFTEHLSGVKIKELYSEFSYKNPPTI